MKKQLIFLCLSLIVFNSFAQIKPDNKINLRLKWAYQAQFAGYLVAAKKGFYKYAGLNVNIEPSGPNIEQYNNVASGKDDVGIGLISQVLTARSNHVPIVAISQIFQDSPTRFAIKGKNKINSLTDLKCKKVGLWVGGDEAEFITMLKTAGMTLHDVTVVPQKFSIDPFLHDDYVCSQVMEYNELNKIKDQGYVGDKLQVLFPKDYNAAILGDLLFTNEKFLATHKKQLQAFLAASYKGWKYAQLHPEEATAIVLSYNPQLNKREQTEQLKAVLSIVFTGNTLKHGIGYMDLADYQNNRQIMLNGVHPNAVEYKKLKDVDVAAAFNNALWSSIEPVK